MSDDDHLRQSEHVHNDIKAPITRLQMLRRQATLGRVTDPVQLDRDLEQIQHILHRADATLSILDFDHEGRAEP
jgi:hypothetical protein